MPQGASAASAAGATGAASFYDEYTPKLTDAEWDMMHYLDPEEVQFAQVPDGAGGMLKLEYQMCGPDTGPRMLLIPGFVTGYWTWDSIIPLLIAHGFRILAFSNRGSSGSDSPAGRYTTAQLAQDAVELLRRIAWLGGPPIHVVGQSMGGMIAQYLAKNPDVPLASLTLISSHLGGWHRLPSYAPLYGKFVILRNVYYGLKGHTEHQSWSILSNLISPAHTDMPPAECGAIASGLFRDPELTDKQRVEWMRAHFSTLLEYSYCGLHFWRLRYMQGKTTGFAGQLAALITHNFTAEDCAALRARNVPILAMHGDADPLVAPENAPLIKAQLGARLVWFAGHYHALNISAPLRVVEEICTTAEAAGAPVLSRAVAQQEADQEPAAPAGTSGCSDI